MKIKLYLIYFALISSINSSQAEVKTKTICYGYQPKNRSAEYYSVLLRTYYDTELQREIGSFVQYNKNSSIPLVFDKNINADPDNPELGNFEIRRLEILDGQITGTYLLVQKWRGSQKREVSRV